MGDKTHRYYKHTKFHQNPRGDPKFLVDLTWNDPFLSDAPPSLLYFSSAASQAGVAATAGEEVKNNHYLCSVNSQGSDFFPLECETFGVWTPFMLKILQSIADRTTFKNGLSPKLARHQLLQLLSVTLWHYNSKMILRHYTLCSDDELDFG